MTLVVYAKIGVKKDGNDLPAAFVALKEGATSSSKSETEVLAAIDAWFTSQVASFKRLRAGLFAVKAVPRSAAGKVSRIEPASLLHLRFTSGACYLRIDAASSSLT